MKRILYITGLIGLGWMGANPGLAQGITPRENEDLKLLAKRKIEKNLSDLLNTLTFEDLTESERKDISAKSYTPTSSAAKPLFFNADVIIEDDIQPDRPTDQIVDLKVEKYLANLDLFYTKAAERSIEFSNIVVSNVKERNYIYLKVYYTQLFKNKNTQSAVAYKPVSRMAEVRVERVGKKWTGAISRLAFLAPGDSATSTLNDVALVAPTAPVDSAAIRLKQEQDELAEAQREQEREKERKLKEDYDSYLTRGDQAFAAKNYSNALELYGEAEKRNKSNGYDDLLPLRKIAQTNRTMNAARVAEGELLREYREKGEMARKRRNYSEALGYYHRILEKRPDSTALQTVIKELTQKSNIKTEYDEQFAAGQYEKLVDEYDKIIKKDNANSDWYLGRAKCYLKLNKDDRALKDLTKSLELDYANLATLLARADLYRKLGNLPKAVTDYSAYLIIDPKNDNVFAQRAQLRIRTNNLTSADDDFTQAIVLNPQQSAYFYERGLLRYRNQKYEAAIADFGKAIELTPAKPEAYFWRGLTYALDKQYKRTGEDFANALKYKAAVEYTNRMDSVSNSLYSMGRQANEAKNYEQAILHLTDALAVRSDLASGLYERGIAHFNQKAYVEAIDDLTASIRYAPNESAAYDRRAEAYMAQHKYDLALADYRQANTLNPANYPGLLGEASAQIELKKFREAITPLMTIKTAQKKIEKNYTSTFFRDVFYRLGKSEYATDQFDKAVDDYSTALKFDETFAAGYADRGAAYEALGKLDRAVEDYQSAIDREPTLPERYFAKAYALEKKGDFTPAVNAYSDVIRKDSTRQLYAKTLLRRGTSYSLMGMYTEALADLEQPIVQTDTALCSYDCWLTTGLTYLYAGKPDAGLPYLTKCLKTPPYAARAAYATACASLLKDNEADALTWFERAFQEKTLTSNEVRKDKLIDVARKDFRKNKTFRQLMDKYLK